ncbi:MAG: type II toxin-antitoxin system RelE/ParE family toxin [Proteobacteria bacterium]|nr:type II toxin-antitoxin system RelE/ParE family toxin [Pseudomonadota bacterium]
MSFRVEFAPAAEAEIIDAFNWYEQQSFGLGGEFLRAVKQSEAALSRNPHLYQILYKEIRRTYLRRFPYALHYLIEDDSVLVLACFHFRRDPKKWS